MKRAYLFILVSILLAACSTTTPATVAAPTNTPTGTIVLTGDSVSIRLPDRYITGNRETVDAVIEELNAMGSSYSGAVQSLEKQRDTYIVFAYDSELGRSGTIANMNIASTSLQEGSKLEGEIQSLVTSYTDAGFKDIETNTCQHDDLECYEIQAAMTVGDIDMKLLQYLVNKSGQVYLVTFGCEASEYPQKYAEFEEAFSTFQILE